jgi:uncharacterized integral membrane protein
MSETGPTPDADTGSARPAQQPSPASTPQSSPQSSVEPTDRPRGGAGSDPLRASRTSGLWTAVVALVVLLVLLAVFVLQNTRSVAVTYFGWEVEAPLAAALLIATAAGGLIVVAAGSLRILQLRRRVRRERKRG